MQAALQRHVDSSISKTINMPRGTTPDMVRAAYVSAWRSGCKGVTVYVDGSRTDVVLAPLAASKKSAPLVRCALPTPLHALADDKSAQQPVSHEDNKLVECAQKADVAPTAQLTDDAMAASLGSRATAAACGGYPQSLETASSSTSSVDSFSGTTSPPLAAVDTQLVVVGPGTLRVRRSDNAYSEADGDHIWSPDIPSVRTESSSPLDIKRHVGVVTCTIEDAQVDRDPGSCRLPRQSQTLGGDPNIVRLEERGSCTMVYADDGSWRAEVSPTPRAVGTFVRRLLCVAESLQAGVAHGRVSPTSSEQQPVIHKEPALDLSPNIPGGVDHLVRTAESSIVVVDGAKCRDARTDGAQCTVGAQRTDGAPCSACLSGAGLVHGECCVRCSVCGSSRC